MNLEELLKSDRPPKKDEITDDDLARLFMKYRGLLKQWERDKVFSAATHENIRIASAKLDELVEERTAELETEITERKRAQERVEHLTLVLHAIRNVNQLITKEKDREKLLKGSCDNLVETRGYSNAWIALLDESGKLIEHAESGLGKDLLPMVERLKRGQLTTCGQQALKQTEAVVTEDPASTCTDCPLSSSYAGRSAATARLEYGGKVYGFLSVSVPGKMATDVEELGLFHEVATDIAFGLYNIELEEKRKQAEGEKREMERKAQLTSRMASIGQMSAGIAHEINNPLTSVIGFTDLLMARKDLPDDVRSDLEVIYNESRRVGKIVKRLLTFARQDKAERDYVNINEIMETTLRLRAYEMETSSIKLKTYLDPDLPNTMAASGQLQQVFLNIIINAEAEMRQAHGKGNFLTKTETVGDRIRISFKDDGPGIAKEHINRIFEPFFTTKEVGKGTGLGLSVCHGIITDHNGRIYVESKRGKGATVIVELPIVSKESQLALAEPEAEEPGKVTGAKILVVDDELGVRQLLSRLLAEEGYEVEAVDNTSDALERIEKESFTLVLMDIRMPNMSGIELYQRIRKIDRPLAERVVFITGDVTAADTKSFLSKSKASYISKPFDTKQLKKEIARLLSETT